jgi:hypothetical protein
MRSIASTDLKTHKRKPTLQLVPREGGDNLVEFDVADGRPTAEQALASTQEEARIKAELLALFNDDLVAQMILENDMTEEMHANEMRALTGLDNTRYASKRRLILRRIAKAFPQGWTS